MAKNLSEIFEDLKAMRRRGKWPEPVEGKVGPIDLKIVELLRATFDGANGSTEDLIRTVEVTILAERVFGDKSKAGAWLERPNREFSGQKPFDLLKDDLGAAVVRETLEQIDHGIFA